jgi:hypothetical protein
MKLKLTKFSETPRHSISDVSRKFTQVPIESLSLFTVVCGGVFRVAVDINNV